MGGQVGVDTIGVSAAQLITASSAPAWHAESPSSIVQQPAAQLPTQLPAATLRGDRSEVEDFKPEFTGKMSFYLTAVDELERQTGDEPSIGLVLCPGRKKTMTEWALRATDAPVALGIQQDLFVRPTPPTPEADQDAPRQRPSDKPRPARMRPNVTLTC